MKRHTFLSLVLSAAMLFPVTVTPTAQSGETSRKYSSSEVRYMVKTYGNGPGPGPGQPRDHTE